MPASRHRATIHSASSSTTGNVHRAASVRQVTVNGSVRRFAAHHTVPPAASSTRKNARPRSRYGISSPASTPTPSAARTTGRPEPGTSGQYRPKSGSTTGGTSTAVGAGAGAGVGHGDLRDGDGHRDRSTTAGRSGGSTGRSRRSTAPVVPAGGSTKRTVPPCRVATQRAMASPRPVPPAAALLGSWARVPNRSNARSRSPDGTPGPSSAISSRQRPSSVVGADPDRAAVGSVPDGVVEQVDDQLAQPGPVGPHGQPVGDVDGEADGPAGGHQLGDGLVQQRRPRRRRPAAAARRRRRPATARGGRRPGRSASGPGPPPPRGGPRRPGTTPSARFSRTAVSPASGVRSSWDTVATRARCSWSTVSSSVAIWLNARASSPTSSADSARTRPR